MAPRAGFEPATKRLTAACSATELPRKNETRLTYNIKFINVSRNFLFFADVLCYEDVDHSMKYRNPVSQEFVFVMMGQDTTAQQGKNLVVQR